MQMIDLKCTNCCATLKNIEKKRDHYFCEACGAEMIIETAYSQEFAKMQAQHDFNVQKESEESKNILSYDRVESLSGKESNRSLFNIYGRLIHPMKVYENSLNSLENEKSNNSDIKSSFIPNIGFFIPLTGILILVFFVMSFVCQFFLDRDLSNQYYKEITESEQEQYLEFSNLYVCSHSFVNCFFSPFKLNVYGRDDFQDTVPKNGNQYDLSTLYVGNHELFVYVVRPAVVSILLILVVYLISIPFTILSLKSNEKKIIKLTDDVARMKLELSKVIVYCPPQFRTAHALEFFYNSFNNSQCDNIKEAVTLYSNSFPDASPAANGLERLQMDYISDEDKKTALDSVMNQFNYSIFA